MSTRSAQKLAPCLALAAALAAGCSSADDPAAAPLPPTEAPVGHPADRFERPAVRPFDVPSEIGAAVQLDRQTRTLAGRAGVDVHRSVSAASDRVVFGVAARGAGGRVVVEWRGSSRRELLSANFAAEGDWPRWQDVALPLPGAEGELAIRVDPAAAEEGGEGDVWVSEPSLLQPPPSKGPRNLVLISIDTLRADMLGSYGYSRFPTSPNLDRLAARGTLFENAFAPSPWTTPSHMALLTGIRPEALGMAKLIGSAPRLARRHATLAELFRDAGYLTAAFTGTATIAGRLGFADGFQLQQEAYNDTATLQRDLDTNLHLALRWLREHRQEPMFLFFHTFEPHNPYVHRRFVGPHAVLDEARQAAYASGIGFTDAGVGSLLDELDALGLLDRSIVVVTSDHGEGLGAPPRLYHGSTLYDEVLHVPLILAGAGVPEGRRVSTQVPLVDLFATLAELYSLPLPEEADARSLWPLVIGDSSEERPVHLCCLAHRGQIRGLRRDGYKYLMTPRSDGTFAEELYDLAADPGEIHNLAAARPRVAQRMRTALVETVRHDRARAAETVRPAPPLEREFESQLRALGYVE